MNSSSSPFAPPPPLHHVGVAEWDPGDLLGEDRPSRPKPAPVALWPEMGQNERRKEEERQAQLEAEIAADAEIAALEEAAREAAEREQREMEHDREVAEAYKRGYEEGREDGELAEAARLRSSVQAAEEALDEIRAGEIRWTGAIEENICALAVTIARQIVGRELTTDIDAVLELVRSALAEIPIDQPVRIRVNPADLESITSQSADGGDHMRSVTRDRDARWFPDGSIAPGGCVVEGRERIIDGRVDTALERVYRRLTYTHA